MFDMYHNFVFQSICAPNWSREKEEEEEKKSGKKFLNLSFAKEPKDEWNVYNTIEQLLTKYELKEFTNWIFHLLIIILLSFCLCLCHAAAWLCDSSRSVFFSFFSTFTSIEFSLCFIELCDGNLNSDHICVRFPEIQSARPPGTQTRTIFATNFLFVPFFVSCSLFVAILFLGANKLTNRKKVSFCKQNAWVSSFWVFSVARQ